MVRCNSCNREIQEGASFCPFCGVAVAAISPPARSASDPYMLLMTANVLRLRRQWALAEAKCSELLREEPENAAAYSLMGDILRDQDRVEDAIEWYKLAVDRNPAGEADRRKLEQLIEQRFAEPRGVWRDDAGEVLGHALERACPGRRAAAASALELGR